VFYQRMQMALFFREIVQRDLLRGGLAIELAIDVSRAGDLKGCEARQREQLPNQFPGNHARRPFQTAGQFEGHGQSILTHLEIGRLLDGDVREFNLIFGLQNGAKALAKKSLLFAIHVGRF
jgi:hypothetical protein